MSQSYPESEHGSQNYPSAPFDPPSDGPWEPDDDEREEIRQRRLATETAEERGDDATER